MCKPCLRAVGLHAGTTPCANREAEYLKSNPEPLERMSRWAQSLLVFGYMVTTTASAGHPVVLFAGAALTLVELVVR